MDVTPRHTLTNLTVIAGLLMVLWQAFISPLGYTFQVMFFVVGIFIAGIPHGALDHIVDEEVSKRNNKTFHLIGFLAKYLIIIAVYALAWYLFPQVSLLLFLLMSCWHFGETDLAALPQKPIISDLFTLVYGACVLLWILIAHYAEVDQILMHLTPQTGRAYQIWLTAGAYKPLLLSGSAGIIAIALLLRLLTNSSLNQQWLTLQLIIILACTYLLPLMPAFALYFAGWHSLVTLYNIKGFIGSTDTANKALSIAGLWIKALPFSLIAILGLVLTGYLLRHYAPLFDPLPLLFVFLSLITLPHLQIMHGLNQRL